MTRRGRAAGVKFVDNLTGEEHTLKARSVVNAAGCFVDDIMHMDSPTHRRMVTPSQGVHIVLDMKFLQSDYAIMVPKTSDGRVLFAVPWHDKVVVGTTDIVRPKAEEDPRPLKEEIDFILGTAGLYMNPAPTYKDILSVFAGQRPLAAPKKEGKNTKEISRSHKIIVSDNGLVTITGGKWTSYRLMAEDTVDKAIEVAKLPARKCVTKKLHIHGYRKNPDLTDHMYVYGSDEPKILELIKQQPELGEKLAEVRLHLRRSTLGRARRDGHDGRRRAFAPRTPALRRRPRSDGRCPEGGAAHGQGTRTRSGMDRRAGKKISRNWRKTYIFAGEAEA